MTADELLTRSVDKCFAELRSLCHQPGFFHAISRIIFRDFFSKVDQQGVVTFDTERYSRARIIHNELMLLVGLAIQSKSPDTYSQIGNTEELVAKADKLLEELHSVLEAPMHTHLDELLREGESKTSFGDIAREAIFYGAQSAFNSQYRDMARKRYREDTEWLLRNRGISIRPIIEIAKYIEDHVNNHITFVMDQNDYQTAKIPTAEISNALLVSKDGLIKKFGDKARAFIALFSTSATDANRGFNTLFDFNEANARPLIDIGEYLYLSNQYKLSESIYESPVHWIRDDDNYKNDASKHRGDFLENSIAHDLLKVFGKNHVFPNAMVRRSKSEIGAEADALIIYGEFLLVIQAKSKRLTLEARAGDTEKLENDFRDAVQSAYDQAIKFIELVLDGHAVETVSGELKTFKFLTRPFPIVVLSDHFPALTNFAHHMVKLREGYFPAIFDIFFLDTLLTLIKNPVEILYYLQQRARYFSKVSANSEVDLLGFHLAHKLFVEEQTDFMLLEQDFGSAIEDFYIARETGRPHEFKFVPFEERVPDIPRIKELTSALKVGPPETSGVAIELLDFSGDTLRSISAAIEFARNEVITGKALKSFSIPTQNGGISYVAVRELGTYATQASEAIAHRHKYELKKDRWYVLLDHVYSRNLVDGILPICRKWEESEELQNKMDEFDQIFKTAKLPIFTPKGSG